MRKPTRKSSLEEKKAKLNTPEADKFAQGATGGGANEEAVKQFKDSGKVSPSTSEEKTNKPVEEVRFNMIVEKPIKEKIEALAWYDRISQKEVVERALAGYYPDDSDHVQAA